MHDAHEQYVKVECCNRAAGDWMCNSCGQHNFRSRAECYKCAAPKCVPVAFRCLAVLRLCSTNTACLQASHCATAGIHCELLRCSARRTGRQCDFLASGLYLGC